MKQRVGFLLAAVVLVVAGGGCSLMEYCPMHMAMRAFTKSGEPADASATAPADAAVKQTTCPVMEGKIDPKLFTDYKGTRVYFCCPGCVDKFMKDPEKYFAKVQNQGA